MQSLSLLKNRLFVILAPFSCFFTDVLKYQLFEVLQRI